MKIKSIITDVFILGLLAAGILGFSRNSGVKTVVVPEAEKTIKIGSQEWMLTNLDVPSFRNGQVIPEARTAEEWKQAGLAGKPAWCYYNNDTLNGKKYGKLYNFYAVIDPRGLSPAGYHIPTSAEWSQLMGFLGTVDIAGTRMKSSEGWSGNGNGTNKSGFTALPGGQRNGTGAFKDESSLGQFWSVSGEVDGGNLRYSIRLVSSSVEAAFIKSEMENGFSVRCIKD